MLEPSVVSISQILTVDKTNLIDLIGKLSIERVRQILAGLILVTEPKKIESDPCGICEAARLPERR